ncbi:Butyryl-CoA dehydrogenase [Serinicoccus hydrothermalis]|uniref:Butyryl-CoA dehydrogenase n=1 Tax=Serinicoccus hydrothermalis TaxID=1758689 RepID=A0A1B1N9J4_9MICO|nr:acyl-CoA dehydrogenase family protein [Serinicoccus hydrothermalis]ANS78088.1 Butyryl-CoA dehydrogenase [Serinicoccus hydrothermalis]
MRPDALTPELADVVARTRDFVREVVVPAEPPTGEALAPQELSRLRSLAKEAGVWAPVSSADFGGLGLPLPAWSPVLQEAGYSPIGPAVLHCMAPDEGNMHMLSLIATPEQQQEFLAPLVRGEARSCFAMTEPHPGAGSDPSALSTTAYLDGDTWVIEGRKRFISGANDADIAIVMARTPAVRLPDGQERPEGATMFLTRTDAPGWRVGRQIRTTERAIAGGHPYVHLEGLRVPTSAVLGEVGEGFRYAQVRLGPARLTHCMRWLGLARRALDVALDRLEHRELFGQPMRDLGLAQGLVADSVIDLETSDAIIDRTARLLESDPRAGSRMSSVAKVHCAEAIQRVIDRSIQLCGGDGVSEELPLVQYLLEVRPFRIYDGSSETHRWAIARRASSDRRREVEAGTPRLDLVDGTDDGAEHGGGRA